ncbi:hypothetical protein MTP99_002621 [Tenebrio molitor]|nr:hypothetical protein MTP99_002621 [Tenebrio molitor]
MDNLTFQEQPFGKLDIKEISDTHYISYSFWGGVRDFLRLFVSIMSICASVVLIYSQAFNTVFKRPSSIPDDLDDDEVNALVQSENS